ncbi:MAG: hypothetical protein HFG65_08360 [Hungatella sp.]|nr:hypothetical protein [Hungatella sp.]
MNAVTMEGLMGASTSVSLMNTPMRVFQEASGRGDTETMKRAMGYAGECADKAEEYKEKADEGMKIDAAETHEKAVREAKEAQEKPKEGIDESRNEDADTDTDTVEISEEGKALLKDSAGLEHTGSQPVTYTKTGETVMMEQGGEFSVSV